MTPQLETPVLPKGVMHLLHDLSLLVARKERLDEVLDFIFENFGGLIPYDCLGYSFVDYNRERVIERWERCDEEVPLTPGYASSLAGSTLQTVIETGQPLILNDLESHLKQHGKSQSTRLLVDHGMRSSLTCPLLVSGRPVGFLFFSSRTSQAYTEADAEVIEDIADHLAWLIERSQLNDQVRLANERVLNAVEHCESLEHSTSQVREQAEDVQQCERVLFPLSLPQPEGFRVGVWKTAGYESGSTFLDVIALPDGRFAFMVVDCGYRGQQGIVLKTVLHTAARLHRWQSGSAGEILGRLNEAVTTCFPEGSFASAIAAVFDPESATIDWTDAGFVPPILVKYAGYAVDGELACPSCHLGDIELHHLVQDQTPLMAGDKFILYTENLLKLRSPQGEAFGSNRFHETLQRAAHESAAGMLQALSAEVERFREGSVDDEDGLVLVIERHPHNQTCRSYPEATGFPFRCDKLLFLAGVMQ